MGYAHVGVRIHSFIHPAFPFYPLNHSEPETNFGSLNKAICACVSHACIMRKKVFYFRDLSGSNTGKWYISKKKRTRLQRSLWKKGTVVKKLFDDYTTNQVD